MINLITDLINFTQPTNLDKESLSVIESIAKIKKVVNECIKQFNSLENKTDEDYNNFLKQLTEYKNEIVDKINKLTDDNKDFKNEFKEYIEYLKTINVTLDYIEEQSKFVQDLAAKNEKAIQDGTVASKSDVTEVENITLKKVWNFKTVEEMKNYTGLKDNEYVSTSGYYSVNDGGGANYLILDDSTLEEDNGGIIKLNNGLFAKMIIKNKTVNVRQYGCKCDGITDDTERLQKTINNKNVRFIIGSIDDNILISKTLKCSMTSIDLKFGTITPTSTGDYEDNYILKVDFLERNDFNNSYVKNIRIINYNDGIICDSLNGILASGNCSIENFYSDSLNRMVKFTNEYSDYQVVRKINSMRKIQNDFVIDMGYLGDAKVCEYIHLAYPQGENNSIKCSGGMLPIKISNVVNSNVNLTNCMCRLSDCHFEDGNIILNNAQCDISNVYMWGGNQIILNNESFAKLSNVAFSHKTSENTTNDYDIVLSKMSKIQLNNVFRRSLGNYIETARKCNIKINISDEECNSFINKNLGHIENNCSIHNNKIYGNYSIYIPESFQIISSLSIDSNGKWFDSLGNYVYRGVCLIDSIRMIGKYNSNNYFQTGSISDTNNVIMLNFSSNLLPSRIYRGSANGEFTKYIDINPLSNILLDSGNHINGIAWKTRDIGDIDAINQIESVKYINNCKNVEVVMKKLPTTGSWCKNDKVIINNKIYICTTGGTSPVFEEV